MTTHRKAATIERDARAWEMRVAGATYSQIGESLGMTKQAAHSAVARHAKTIPVELIKDVKDRMLAQLDYYDRRLREAINAKHYVVTQTGRVVLGPDGRPLEDYGPMIQAIRAGVQVFGERARVWGAYAPTQSRVDVITRDAFMEDFAKLEAEVAAKRAEVEAREHSTA